MGNTVWTWKIDVESGRSDQVLLQAIQSGKGSWTGESREVSRSFLKRLMEDERVRVSGITIKPSDKLKLGAIVTVEFPPAAPTELVPEDRQLEILFEDESLVVINKPQGLTVHPSSSQKEGTLVHALLFHIKDLSGIGGVLRPGIVHRIDKDTSGALVITKTDKAHQKLSEIFSRHEIQREYWALCYGAPTQQGEWTKIESLIGRHPTDRKRMSMKVKEGRKAVTYFQKISEFGVPRAKPFASWLRVKLETGRTHQVRVHLTGLGHSILGDPVYGVPTERQPKWLAIPKEIQGVIREVPGQMLHARVLGFKHPISGKDLLFEAPVSPAFEKVLSALKKYDGSSSS